MFRLLPPLDIVDGKAFLAAAATVFSEYAPEVMDKAVFAIARASDRPTLKTISQIIADINERALEREAVATRKLPPPPRKPRAPEEQQRVDAMVAETRKALGIPLDGLRNDKFIPKPSDSLRVDAPGPRPSDGNHARRVQAELDARKAKKEATNQA